MGKYVVMFYAMHKCVCIPLIMIKMYCKMAILGNIHCMFAFIYDVTAVYVYNSEVLSGNSLTCTCHINVQFYPTQNTVKGLMKYI